MLRTFAQILLTLTLFPALAFAAEPPHAQVADSGSFAVLINGQAVAREAFTITRTESGSLTESTIRVLDASRAEHRIKLELTPAGALRRYEWRESSPGHGHLTLLPDGDFLKQQYGATPEESSTQAYALTPATAILDDNFFVLRELLIWAYLRDDCKPEGNRLTCPGKPAPPSRIAVLAPLRRYSMQVSLQLQAVEPATAGRQAGWLRFQLEDDTGLWTLWLDRDYKLQELAHDGDPARIVREIAGAPR